VQAVINSCVRLPSEHGDFNDLYLRHGLEKVKAELVEHKLGIQKYAIRNLIGKPEPQKFLVEGLIPIGKPGILAAVGGVGKSLSVIQLALSICCGGRWWGKDIVERGNSVIFCAEDDLMEIHRRLDLLDPKGKRFNSSYEVYVFPIPEQKEPMILLREEGITPIAQELVEELKAIPDLKLVCFDPLQAFTTGNVSSSNEAGQLWGSYCANISARLGCATLTIHHLNKGALANDSDDAMSHRAEIRGASSITDSVRWAIAMWLASAEDCERICEEQRVAYERMSVVKAALVKSNSGNVDYTTKTLFRKDGVLEPLEELQNPLNLYDQF
jgi:RecA-family ATPase